MLLLAFFLFEISYSREIHVPDVGLVFTKTTNEFLLVTENTHVVNFMQPIFLQCEMRDKNSHFYLNVLDETSRMIQHSGMGSYVKNLTDETWVCEDLGYTANCLFMGRPFDIGKSLCFFFFS